MGTRAVVISVLVMVALVFFAGCKSGDKDGPVVETTSPKSQPAPAETVQPELAPEVVTEQAPVPLHLAFVAGQTASYTVTAETEKSITWEGDASRKPKEFTGGVTGSRVEIGFEQLVEGVDDDGVGLLKITIKSVKYIGRVRGDVVLEYDSAGTGSQNRPLARLVGQSYKIKMTPKGEVLSLVDMATARQTVEGGLPENRTALRLLSDRVVKERHEVTPLMCLEAETVSDTDKWSDVKKFSFGMMGLKAYERVYTLEAVSPKDGARVAVVKMHGVPSSALAAEMAQPEPTNPFAGMADSTGTYDGQLDLDLDTGQIERNVEQLKAQWLVVDPTSAQDSDAAPAVLRMLATQLYELERLD